MHSSVYQANLAVTGENKAPSLDGTMWIISNSLLVPPPPPSSRPRRLPRAIYPSPPERNPTSPNSHAPLSLPLPPHVSHQHAADDAQADGDAANDGDADEALAGDLVVDEGAQIARLEVGGLLLEEEVVVAAGLGVVAEPEVAQGEVVEALAAALGGGAEDLGEEDDA